VELGQRNQDGFYLPTPPFQASPPNVVVADVCIQGQRAGQPQQFSGKQSANTAHTHACEIGFRWQGYYPTRL
jgi:hypothetical protein